MERARDERGRFIGADDPRGLSARFVLGRARELEARDLAVSRMIGNRLDLYYVQWRVPRRRGR